MKNILFLLLSVVQLNLLAQNKIDIDIKSLSFSPSIANIGQNYEISFKNCNLLENNLVHCRIDGIETFDNREFVCTDGIKLQYNIKSVIFIFKLSDGKSSDLNLYFEEGKISKTRINPEIKKNETAALVFNDDFVKPSFFIPNVSSELCRYPRVEYDPCCNKASLFLPNDQEKNNLVYKSKFNKNEGVVFIIPNFNTLKYNISMSNTFTKADIEMPAIFDQAYSVIGKIGTGQSGDIPGENVLNYELDTFLMKVVKLNVQLKKFIQVKLTEEDCYKAETFEKQKKDIIYQIENHFDIVVTYESLKQAYSKLKTRYIDTKNKSEEYNNASFNNEIKKAKLKGEISPDSLVQETSDLINWLIGTKFEYQYNVPKILDYDKIVFNLNILPKKEGNGSIHLVNQSIEVPIYGGWRLDFSTGFFYSNLRNESFSLVDSIREDSVVLKKIVNSKNDALKINNTFGATALMHIYPRVGRVQPAVCFGVGLGLDLNLAMLTGVSLMFGKENRIGISAGLNLSNIKLLSNQYYRDKELILVRPEIDELNYYNKIKSGVFVSITYNLSGQSNMIAGVATSESSEPADEEEEQANEENEEEVKED